MLEWLKTILGETYTDDIDKKVSDQVGKDFVARADFNGVNETKKTLESTIKEREKQIEELKKVDPKDLQTKIAELQAANTEAQTQYAAELKQIKIDNALEARLHTEGAVNTKAVRALLDQTKLGLDGENLIGLDDQLKSLKETEKWAFTAANGKPAGAKSGTHQGNPPAAGTETTAGDEILTTMYGKAE